MEARLTGSKRGALVDVSDTSDRSGAPATPHVPMICDYHPCPIASRACPGQRHCSTASEAAQPQKAPSATLRHEVEQDMHASEVDTNRTPSTVRAHPVRRPAISL